MSTSTVSRNRNQSPVDIVGIPAAQLAERLDHVLAADDLAPARPSSLLGIAETLGDDTLGGTLLPEPEHGDDSGHEDMLPQLRVVDALLGKDPTARLQAAPPPFPNFDSAERRRRQRRKRNSGRDDPPPTLPPPTPEAENDRLLLEEIASPAPQTGGWTAVEAVAPPAPPLLAPDDATLPLPVIDEVIDSFLLAPAPTKPPKAVMPMAPVVAETTADADTISPQEVTGQPDSPPLAPAPLTTKAVAKPATKPKTKMRIKSRHAKTPPDTAVEPIPPLPAPPPPSPEAETARPAVKLKFKPKARMNPAAENSDAPLSAASPVAAPTPPLPAPPPSPEAETARPAVKLKVKSKARVPHPTAENSEAPLGAAPVAAATPPLPAPPPSPEAEAVRPAVKLKVKPKARVPHPTAENSEAPLGAAPVAAATPPLPSPEAETASPAVKLKVKSKARVPHPAVENSGSLLSAEEQPPSMLAPDPQPEDVVPPTAPADAAAAPEAPPPDVATAPAEETVEKTAEETETDVPDREHSLSPLVALVESIIASHRRRHANDDARERRGNSDLPDNHEALAALLDETGPQSDFPALDLLYACWNKSTHASDSRALLAVAQQLGRNFGLPDKLPMATSKAWKMLDPVVFAPEIADRLADVGDFIADWQKTQRIFLILEFGEIELIEYLFESLSPADYPDLLAQVMNYKVLSNRRMGLLRRIPARLRRQIQPMLPERKEEALVLLAHGKALLQRIADPSGFAPIVEVAGKMVEEVEKLMKQTAGSGGPPSLGGPPGAGGGQGLGRIG